MPILGLDALQLASSPEAAILAHASQDGVCICTEACKLELDPNHAPGAPWDTSIEGTPIRVATPGSIANRAPL